MDVVSRQPGFLRDGDAWGFNDLDVVYLPRYLRRWLIG